MTQKTDSTEPTIFDEDEFAKADFGFKSVLMMHLNRISINIDNISKVGRKREFAELIKVLYTMLNPYMKRGKHRTDYETLLAKHNKHRESRELLWNKLRVDKTQLGEKVLCTINQQAYNQECIDINYNYSHALFEILNKVIATHGWGIEQISSTDIKRI